MEGKASSQMERILPDVCLLRSGVKRCSFTFLNVIFGHQNVAHSPLNATEMVRFLKTNKIWIFENRWFFEKKIMIFFDIAKGGQFFVECVSNGIIS